MGGGIQNNQEEFHSEFILFLQRYHSRYKIQEKVGKNKGGGKFHSEFDLYNSRYKISSKKMQKKGGGGVSYGIHYLFLQRRGSFIQKS